jgi:hypothetical protein
VLIEIDDRAIFLLPVNLKVTIVFVRGKIKPPAILFPVVSQAKQKHGGPGRIACEILSENACARPPPDPRVGDQATGILGNCSQHFIFGVAYMGVPTEIRGGGGKQQR